MEKNVKIKPVDFNKYFKGLDLKKRVSVIETAQNLLKVQKSDSSMLAAIPPHGEAENQGLA